MKPSLILSMLVLSSLIIPWHVRGQESLPSATGGTGTAEAQEVPPEDVVTLARGLEQVMSASHDVLITQEGEMISSAESKTTP